jgi:CRP-like cAMP-binding protein
MRGAIAAFLSAGVPLFRRVPRLALRDLASHAVPRRYSRGQYVCRTGDPAREIWIVREGRLCVNQCGWKGNRLSIEVMIPGDVSGLAAVACQTYPGEVIALRESLLIAIPRGAVLAAIEAHPVLAREILYAYGQRLHYIETLLYLSREPVRKRLIAALLYLHEKFGASLTFTRAEIAEMAGTTPETAMRLLGRLDAAGLLRRRRGSILLLDARRLKAELET